MSTEFMALFLLELSFIALTVFMFTVMSIIAFKLWEATGKLYDCIVRQIERWFR